MHPLSFFPYKARLRLAAKSRHSWITASALQSNCANAERINAQLEGIKVPYSFGGAAFWQAQIAVALGNMDQAMVFLRRAFSAGTTMDDWIHRAPAFRSLLDYPPFQAMLQPIG